MNRHKEIELMMRKAGFVCVRSKKHAIWKHPTGATIATSLSPSDQNAIRQSERLLAKVCLKYGISWEGV